MVLWFQGVVLWDFGSAQLVRSLSILLTHRAKSEDQRSVNVVQCCGHHREWCARWQTGHVRMHIYTHKDTHRGNVPPLSVLLWTVSWRVKLWPENKSVEDTPGITLVVNERGTWDWNLDFLDCHKALRNIYTIVWKRQIIDLRFFERRPYNTTFTTSYWPQNL